MAERVRVVRHDGRLLAAKQPGSAGAEGLRAEAALLDRARVAGVVELVGVRTGDAPLLLTAWVGPRSLAELPRPLDPDHAAAICLAVAGTLQRLHRSGVVHGAVEPSHVLLDEHGRPVLCGFGHAGSIGAPVRRPPTDRPAMPGVASNELHSPADDVAGLGRLLADLVGPVPPTGLRPAARRSATRWRALSAAADHARADDPDARPSLASLTRSIRRAAPGAALPGSQAITSPSDDGPALGAGGASADPATRRPRPFVPDPAPRRRSPAPLLAAVAVFAVGATTYFGLSATWSARSSRTGGTAAGVRAPSTTRATVATTATSTTTPPTTAAATTTTSTPTSDPAATADAAPVDATVVVHEGRRYAIGAPGDVVVIGPWRCDGIELPAVLRTGDGTVSVFDSWAAPGSRSSARPVATLAGATGLVAVADGPGCVVLSVTGASGPLTTLTAADLR